MLLTSEVGNWGMAEVKGITSYFHGDFQTGVLRMSGELTVLGLVDSTCLVVSVGAEDLRDVAGTTDLENL